MALLKENITSDLVAALQMQSAHAGVASAAYSGGSHDPQVKRKVIRFDEEYVKKHIKKVMKKNSKETTFFGIEQLKRAAEEGLLRQGQLVFGTVSIAHHLGKYYLK